MRLRLRSWEEKLLRPDPCGELREELRQIEIQLEVAQQYEPVWARELEEALDSKRGELVEAGCYPTYRGRSAWQYLFKRYGAPSAAPRPGERLFGKSRVLFVDDFSSGSEYAVAFWVPEGDPAWPFAKEHPDKDGL